MLYAQEPVAPTPDRVGSVAGDTRNGYNVVNSFEFGYRFLSLSGDEANYRSAVNFGNGIRLLGSSLTVNSKTGNGLLFDDAFLTTEGLGGDPYENTSFRVEKNRVFSYNGVWRKTSYYNPGLVTDGGEGVHLTDTQYGSQDHNLTIFPASHIRVLLGYSRDTQAGQAVSTEQLLDSSGAVFPLFTNVKRQRNEFRIGSEFHWRKTVFVWTRAWVDFKDDSQYNASNVTAIPNVGGSGSLSSFTRLAPFHGTLPYWTAALFHNSSLFNVNARFTYTSGAGTFISNENAVSSSFLVGQSQQIVTAGQGRRPIATGNLTASIFPTAKLSITSHTSLYNVRTEGDSAFLQFDNATQANQIVYFQSLGIRTFSTSADASYQASKWFSVSTGYQFSTRRINSVEDATVGGTLFSTPFSQTNDLHAGNVALRIRPWKTLTLTMDGEIGSTSLPFTPKSDGNYHAVRGAASYRTKRFQGSASLRDDRNATSVFLSAYSAHTRSWSANASWSGSSWLSFDASYSKLHVNTLGGINFFADGSPLPNQFSYYISNLHMANFGVRLNSKNRLTLFLGASLTKDTGDGRSEAATTSVGPAIPGFQVAQTFPLQYVSPMVRVSIRLNERIRWNAGYQLFDYSAGFFPGLNFAARTGYTSVLWSF